MFISHIKSKGFLRLWDETLMNEHAYNYCVFHYNFQTSRGFLRFDETLIEARLAEWILWVGKGAPFGSLFHINLKACETALRRYYFHPKHQQQHPVVVSGRRRYVNFT